VFFAIPDTLDYATKPYMPINMIVDIDENVVLTAVEVVGTSLVVAVGVTGVGPSMLGTTIVGLLNVAGATFGATTMDVIGMVVGKDVVSFDRIGAAGTAGGITVGTLGAAGDAIASHWKVGHDLLSTAIHRSHGSTTLRH
jgi:hypothetical protein